MMKIISNLTISVLISGPFFVLGISSLVMDSKLNPFTLASLGGKIRIPTLKNDIDLKIPAGTQPGQQLRLRGHGITDYKGRKGDLRIQVKVEIPKSLTDRQKMILNELSETFKK